MLGLFNIKMAKNNGTLELADLIEVERVGLNQYSLGPRALCQLASIACMIESAQLPESIVERLNRLLDITTPNNIILNTTYSFMIDIKGRQRMNKAYPNGSFIEGAEDKIEVSLHKGDIEEVLKYIWGSVPLFSNLYSQNKEMGREKIK